MTQEIIKPWQKGYPLQELKDTEKLFDSFNSYARHELTKFKKMTIADALSKGWINKLSDTAMFQQKKVKSKGRIFMYPGVELGTKLPGDIEVKFLAYGSQEDKDCIIDALKNIDENVWLFIHEENPDDVEIASKAGFYRVGVKISSFADLIGIYFRDASTALVPREHPNVDAYQKYTLEKSENVNFAEFAESVKKKLEDENVLDFENHYSNYNKGKSWSALSLYGYDSDPTYIMTPHLKKADKEKTTLQETTLMDKFPEVRELMATHFDAEFERVRFMKLQPGGGELERHTDQEDYNVGLADGQIIRLHIPIKTNDDVIFTMWDTDANKRVCHMKEGELWLIDTRKPHQAVNGGDDIRIHLVMDIKCNDFIRNLFHK